MAIKRKIAVVTSSRADYCHLYWVLVELSKRNNVELVLLTIGPHLSSEFGCTANDVLRDGFVSIHVECLLSSDTDVGMAKTIGVATLGLSDCLGSLRPDLLLLIADRYEMLAPAAVALALRIPVAHIEGGDVSLGAIDEAVRNALTKLSHLHFTTTETARRRVISLGEEPWRVHVAGSPSLDHISRGVLIGREEVERQLNFSLGPTTIVVIYHPVTLCRDTLCETEELFAALEALPQDLLFIGPNSDAGSRDLRQQIVLLTSRKPNVRFLTSIDHRTYLSLLQFVAAVVGNSSSGIMETASFKLPTVNIGMRQNGREHARNVVDCAPDRNEIVKAVNTALSESFRSSLLNLINPYGDGHSAEKIAAILSTIEISPSLLAKAPAPIHLQAAA